MTVRFNAAAFKAKLRQNIQRAQNEMRRKVDQINMRNPFNRYLRSYYPSLYNKLSNGQKLSSWEQERLSEAMQKYARR